MGWPWELPPPTKGDSPEIDPLPQDTVFWISGEPNNLPADPVTNPLTGVVRVANVDTMSKSALMVTTQAGTAAQFMDTQFRQH